METLVLANNYVPINRVRWRKALSYILKGRAVLVEEYEDRYVNSGNDVFPMPAVVRLVNTIKGLFQRIRRVKFNKANVWLRDKGACQYCRRTLSKREFTYDHVLPQSKGGKTCWENIVVACYSCNQRKAGRTPEEAGMELLTKPVMPRSLPGGGFLSFTEEPPASWKDYLGSLVYWESSIT